MSFLGRKKSEEVHKQAKSISLDFIFFRLKKVLLVLFFSGAIKKMRGKTTVVSLCIVKFLLPVDGILNG